MDVLSAPSAPAAPSATSSPDPAEPVWRLRWLTPGRCRLLFAALLLFGFLSHVRYLTHDCPVDLSGDEAQYWDWSRQLDWSYYSKGPLVAYIIRASCWAFGRDTMFTVRFPALLLGVGTSVVSYLLTLKLFRSDRLALGVTLLYTVVPMFAAGSVLMTIDPPFFFCWALATYLAAVAVFDGRRWAWAGIGVAAGMGFLAKYAMFLWFLPLVLFLLTDRDARPLLKSRWPWLAMGVAVLFTTPVVVWNVKHHWVSVRHVATQTGANSAGHFNPGNVLEFVGGQVAIVGPTLFLLMTAAVLYAVRPWRRAVDADAGTYEALREVPPRSGVLAYERPGEGPTPSALSRAAAAGGLVRRLRNGLLRVSPAAPRPEPFVRPMRFLACFGVAFFAVNLLAAFRTKIQLNWPAPTYFALMVLTAYFLSTRLRDRRTWRPWRGWFYATVGLGLLLTPVAHNVEILYPAIRWVNARAPGWRQEKHNPLLAWLGKRVPKDGLDARDVDFTAKLKGWQQLGAVLSDEVDGLGPGAFVMCDDYQQTAAMGFYMRGRPKAFYCGSYYKNDPKRQTQYDVWPDRSLGPESPRVGCNAIYLGHIDRPIGDLTAAFDRVEGVTVMQRRVIDGQPVVRPETRAVVVTIVRDGVEVRDFRYLRCYGFKGMTRPKAKDTY